MENKKIKENENIELKQQIPDNTKGEGKFIIDSDKLDISECLDDNSSEIVAVLCDDDKSNSNILNLKEANDIESNINRKNTDTKLEEIGDVIEINKISGKVVEQNFISEFDNLNVKQNINNQPSLNEARYENVNKSNDFIIGLKEQNINKSTTLNNINNTSEDKQIININNHVPEIKTINQRVKEIKKNYKDSLKAIDDYKKNHLDIIKEKELELKQLATGKIIDITLIQEENQSESKKDIEIETRAKNAIANSNDLYEKYKKIMSKKGK